MHLAYPPRKNSNAARYMPVRKVSIPRLWRSKRVLAFLALLLIGLFWLFSGGRKKPGVQEHIPSGKPAVVIVTVIDTTNYPTEYIKSVRENRESYAKLHGYETHIAKIGDYDLNGSPFSWTKVVAIRHAMTKFPDAKFIWYLESDAFIMNPKFKLEDVMEAKALEKTMIRDKQIVPPDSIIKTLSHLRGNDIDLVLTQDKAGLAASSFILRNGEWARFMVDTWFDPMYRSYNFQKAELHALEHIIQWHPTILSRMTLVPQNLINAYSGVAYGSTYQENDAVMRLAGCTKGDGDKSCSKEGGRIVQKWRTAFSNA